MNPGDLFKPASLYRLACRPALPKDTPDVLALTREIWEGHDYVPHVWAEWLADPQGLLAVAEWGGRVLGLVRLSPLAPQEWWLHGLRVHPEFQGRGIASRLFDYSLDWWQRSAGGTLRLATASFRKPVQHLCERSGFRKVGEYSNFAAAACGERMNQASKVQAAKSSGFEPLAVEDIPAALAFVQASEGLSLSFGLLDLGWEWAGLSEYTLRAAVERRRAWWWRGRAGLLLAYDDDDDAGEEWLAVSLAACPRRDMAALLLDARELAGGLGRARLSWIAPLHPDLLPALAAAGFERTWESAVYVYEKHG